MTHDVVVIGAGLAGLQCARRLREKGIASVVLDKSRGVSGRCATRRWDGVPIDHGAQFFTARDPQFVEQVEDWVARDICHVWDTRMHQWRDGVLGPDQEKSKRPHYVCRNGMSALGKDLARDLDVRLETEVHLITSTEAGWKVVTTSGERFEAARLVCTAPMPQVCAWFGESKTEAWYHQLEADRDLIRMLPCLALLLHCPGATPEWRGIHVEDERVSWIADDSSKRPAQSSGRFVVHASPGFSEEWQDADLEEAGRRLLARANDITAGLFENPAATAIHRWRYARATEALHQGATPMKTPAPLILAGDAHHSERVSGAWLSGLAAADLLA